MRPYLSLFPLKAEFFSLFHQFVCQSKYTRCHEKLTPGPVLRGQCLRSPPSPPAPPKEEVGTTVPRPEEVGQLPGTDAPCWPELLHSRPGTVPASCIHKTMTAHLWKLRWLSAPPG